jgi:hypothetical protein
MKVSDAPSLMVKGHKWLVLQDFVMEFSRASSCVLMRCTVSDPAIGLFSNMILVEKTMVHEEFILVEAWRCGDNTIGAADRGNCYPPAQSPRILSPERHDYNHSCMCKDVKHKWYIHRWKDFCDNKFNTCKEYEIYSKIYWGDMPRKAKAQTVRVWAVIVIISMVIIVTLTIIAIVIVIINVIVIM